MLLRNLNFFSKAEPKLSNINKSQVNYIPVSLCCLQFVSQREFLELVKPFISSVLFGVLFVCAAPPSSATFFPPLLEKQCFLHDLSWDLTSSPVFELTQVYQTGMRGLFRTMFWFNLILLHIIVLWLMQLHVCVTNQRCQNESPPQMLL